VRERGPLLAVTASHPHFYGVAVEWLRAFSGARVLVPEADSRWLMRPDPSVQLWSDTLDLAPGVQLVQCGGHFAGSAVMHWKQGAEGRGALFTGDTIAVAADRRFTRFMRSYPNDIPLAAETVRRLGERVARLRFQRLYSAWWDATVAHDAHDVVQRSVDRYIRWVSGAEDPDT